MDFYLPLRNSFRYWKVPEDGPFDETLSKESPRVLGFRRTGYPVHPSFLPGEGGKSPKCILKGLQTLVREQYPVRSHRTISYNRFFHSSLPQASLRLGVFPRGL